MLIDTQYLSKSKKLLVSFIDASGDMKVKYFDWQSPFKYEVCSWDDPDRSQRYHSWDNKPIKKVYHSYPDRYSTYEFLDGLDKKETEEIFKFYLPKIYFIDIEVEVLDGFPDPSEAPTMVQSISIVYDDKIILLGLKDLTEDTQIRIKNNTNKYFEKFDSSYKFKYIKYEDEFNMLYSFFNKMLPKMPCITGWNFLDFDWRFLVNRARKITKTINNKTYHIDPRVSSFSKKLNQIWGTDYEIPAHKLVFDYMLLYDSLDTSVKVKESKSLDFVSEKLLRLKKIEYKGSLMSLYEEDFETFMYYNAVDSVLVQKIHEVGKYINIIFAIASTSKIKATDVYSYSNGALGSLAITEGLLREMFREDENIILFKDKTKNISSTDSIAGGWVKEPAVGMNKWVSCYDFASLYPITQRQFFISPENYKGKKDVQNPDICIGLDGRKMEIKKDDVVCVNGSVFKKNKSPTLKMLEKVYADRKQNKKIMNQKKLEMDEIDKQIQDLENQL